MLFFFSSSGLLYVFTVMQRLKKKKKKARKHVLAKRYNTTESAQHAGYLDLLFYFSLKKYFAYPSIKIYILTRTCLVFSYTVLDPPFIPIFIS